MSAIWLVKLQELFSAEKAENRWEGRRKMFDKSKNEMKKIEKNMDQVESRIRENICEIGRLFYDANKDKDETDDSYKDLMETVRQLEKEKKELYREKLKLQGLMQCESCNNLIAYGSTFCNHCGQKTGMNISLEKKKICPFCGTQLDEDTLFCVSCGKQLDGGEA